MGSKANQTEKQSYFRKYESMNIMHLFPKIKMNTNELMNNLYNLKKKSDGVFFKCIRLSSSIHSYFSYAMEVKMM